MSLLLKIADINNVVIPIIAILCNILLLWLTKIVKTKNLIHINYSLVPNSILDIALSIATFLAAPLVFQEEENFYQIFGGLFGVLGLIDGSTFVSYITSFFGGLLITSMASITISFYVRYLIICRNQTITIKTVIFPYFLLFYYFISCYLLFLWFYLSSNGFTKNGEATFITILWKEEYKSDPLIVTNKILSVQILCCFGFLLTTFTFVYGLIYYFSTQISKSLKIYIDNSNTNLLHKQIQRTLFIQACGPSLIGSCPVVLIIIKCLFQFRINGISIILSMFFPWVSITNPIAAFIFIKPYRDYIKTKLKCVLKPFKRNVKISLVLPIQNN